MPAAVEPTYEEIAAPFEHAVQLRCVRALMEAGPLSEVDARAFLASLEARGYTLAPTRPKYKI